MHYQNKQQEANSHPKTNQVSEQDCTCNIKGNKNSKGEKIYHMPGQQFYDKTNAEETFCSAAEAKAAGYRASKKIKLKKPAPYESVFVFPSLPLTISIISINNSQRISLNFSLLNNLINKF